jgi:septal ring factor EnvC (AmiA/AmiB activator)
MAKVKKKKEKKDSVFSGNQVMMMLEQVMDGVGILAENHRTLENKMDQRFDKMDQRFDGFEQEVKENFSAVFEYLAKIEDEIMDIKKELKKMQKNKAERRMVLELTERVSALESEIAILKKQKVFSK